MCIFYVVSDKMLNNLPEEVLVTIFSSLSLQTLLLNLRPTCKYFRDIVNRNGYLWRNFEPLTNEPLRLSIDLLENILRHSHHFRKFAIPYCEIAVFAPTLDNVKLTFVGYIVGRQSICKALNVHHPWRYCS